MSRYRIGVDLGGTKIEAILLDESGQPLFRERSETPQGDYQATLQAIVELIDRAGAEINQEASVGIATPGAISPATGLLKNSNSVCLNGRPLLDDLQSLLGRDIRIANDADCFTLSEATDGAAAGAASVFGVIVGTGTGGGLVFNGRLLQGPNAIAGEWGHNPLPWPVEDEQPGPDCYCGKQGCIETWLSGPGMARDYQRQTGEVCTAADIVSLSVSRPDAEACLQRYEDRMARALASAINIFDPEVIVLGGGMSNIERLYENVPRLWGKYVFSDHVATKLLPPVQGDSSGVHGAAWLWD